MCCRVGKPQKYSAPVSICRPTWFSDTCQASMGTAVILKTADQTSQTTQRSHGGLYNCSKRYPTGIHAVIHKTTLSLLPQWAQKDACTLTLFILSKRNAVAFTPVRLLSVKDTCTKQVHVCQTLIAYSNTAEVVQRRKKTHMRTGGHRCCLSTWLHTYFTWQWTMLGNIPGKEES